MSAWVFCRDGLQRRSSMYCISLDFRRDKEGESEAKSWPNRCGLSLNFWDRTVQVNWVERWVFGSAQVKAKIIYDWSADGWSGPDVFKLQGPWGTIHRPVSLLIAHRTRLVEFSRVWPGGPPDCIWSKDSGSQAFGGHRGSDCNWLKGLCHPWYALKATTKTCAFGVNDPVSRCLAPMLGKHREKEVIRSYFPSGVLGCRLVYCRRAFVIV